MPSPFYPNYPGDLHPDAEALLTALAGEAPPSFTDPAQVRQGFMPAHWLEPVPAGVSILEIDADGVPVRLFQSGEAPDRPVLVFFHGGGFVVGLPEEFEGFCARLAHRTGWLVAFVDYRLAPEHPFPAAHEDAWQATRWLAAHARTFGGDPEHLALMGDSAGGNLVTQIARKALEQGGPRIAHQVLLCPWVDLRDEAEEADAFRHFGSGPWLSTESLRWFRGHYLGSARDLWNPRISPLLAEDFGNLPPATVITAEFDILRDQGRAYAERLQAAGVPVTHREVPGMLHDFTVLPGVFTPAHDVLDQIADILNAAFAAEPID